VNMTTKQNKAEAESDQSRFVETDAAKFIKPLKLTRSKADDKAN
jgi:hypothetical protein